MHWDHMDGWGMMFGMGIFWLAVIIGVILAIRFFAQQPRGGGSPRKSEESPLDVLKKRYARGEISKEEYERIKQDIAA